MSMIARANAVASGSSDLERQIREVYGGSVTSSGVTVNSDSAMRVGAVYSCVLVLAQSVAQMPFHLFERTDEGKSQTFNHYLHNLVCDSPNGWMTEVDMFSLLMVHLCLRGNSLWLKTRFPGQSRIRELIPIHPDLVVGAEQDSRYRIKYKVKRPNSSIIDEIPADKILHFRGLSTNGFWGINPIENAREMIGLSIAAEKHGAKLFSNGARLGGILMHPGKLNEKSRKNIRESFDSAHAGVENAHKTVLFEEGMKWQSVTMTAVDTQFLESRKFQRSEIAGWFRVPSHLINDLEKATFSNVEHLDLSFVKHTLMPYLKSIERTCENFLMTDEERKKYFFKFNAEGLLRGDTKTRYEAIAKAVGGPWMSKNEAREIEDMNAVEGGDKILEPLNMGGNTDEPEEAPAN